MHAAGDESEEAGGDREESGVVAVHSAIASSPRHAGLLAMTE